MDRTVKTMISPPDQVAARKFTIPTFSSGGIDAWSIMQGLHGLENSIRLFRKQLFRYNFGEPFHVLKDVNGTLTTADLLSPDYKTSGPTALTLDEVLHSNYVYRTRLQDSKDFAADLDYSNQYLENFTDSGTLQYIRNTLGSSAPVQLGGPATFFVLYSYLVNIQDRTRQNLFTVLRACRLRELPGQNVLEAVTLLETT
ncbi:MAG: hypothetical protein AAGJ35_10680, partial [Myxococcota bacterium]